VPLHAREVVEAEGFTDFGNRRRRLELSLREYCLGGSGWNLTADGLLDVLRLSRRVKIDAARATAHSGDATYQGRRTQAMRHTRVYWIMAPTCCLSVLSRAWTRSSSSRDPLDGTCRRCSRELVLRYVQDVFPQRNTVRAR
jgi:hypothetical protein